MTKKTVSNKKTLLLIVSVIIALFAFQHSVTAWPVLSYKKPVKETYQLSQSNTVPTVLNYLKNNYIDPNRIDSKAMLKGGLDLAQKLAPEMLVTFQENKSFTMTIDQATKTFSLGGVSSISGLWDTLKEAFTFIDLHYHGDVDRKDLEYATIEGMLNTLDPHTSFLSPKIYNEFKIGTKGQFGGIGIVIGTREGRLTVIAPLEGSPAFKVGIKAKDVIIQIEDDSTINMSVTDAVEKLRGKVGTSVTISVERERRTAPFTVTLKRAIIEIDSINATIFPVGDKTIGYIKIKSFQEETYHNFKKALENIKTQAGGKLTGLILDLRNNPGGLLDQSTQVVDEFISNSVIVSTVGSNDKFLDEVVARATEAQEDYPIVALVNEGSASASEIVAGSLQGNNRALVIGGRTFGKGTVQTVYDLHDGAALKLTIAQYLTAGRYPIQTVGVWPDIRTHSMILDKKHMDIVEDEHRGEEGLEKHLTKLLNPSPHADYVVNYFKKSEEENEDEASRKEYSKTIDIRDDFAAEIARDIIAQTTSSKPSEMISTTKALILVKEKEQEAKIQEALRKLGIDWSRGPLSEVKPRIDFSFEIRQDGKTSGFAEAGKTIDLVLTAKNSGSTPVYRLIGVSKTEDDLFLKNKEFVFGRLAPGESRSWSAQIKIPLALPSETLPVNITFTDANNTAPADYKILVPVKGVARPRFAFSFKLLTPLTVNPEGALPKGKSIPFEVKVKNIGDGVTDDAVVILRNPEETVGVFIETGRVKLGKIAPGETKKALFKFHVNPKESTKEEFNLELSCIDTNLFEALTKKITFISGSGNTTPAAGVWHQGPEITLQSSKYPLQTQSATQNIAGVIKDDHQVKDYYIYVGEDKVWYKSNPNESPTFNLDAQLPLKQGNNIVTVEARDDTDLATKSVFVIQRGNDAALFTEKKAE